jgi:hypothetical protein
VAGPPTPEYIYIYIYVHPRPQGFLPELDEFYFTTAEKENFGKLQMHCSEFHR